MGEFFLTGSRAYGTPREDSDIDLVMLLPPELIALLWGQCDSKALRFGRLNIIACNNRNDEDRERFTTWRRVTGELIAERPVSRQDAIARFAANGIEPRHYPEEEKVSES